MEGGCRDDGGVAWDLEEFCPEGERAFVDEAGAVSTSPWGSAEETGKYFVLFPPKRDCSRTRPLWLVWRQSSSTPSGWLE